VGRRAEGDGNERELEWVEMKGIGKGNGLKEEERGDGGRLHILSVQHIPSSSVISTIALLGFTPDTAVSSVLRVTSNTSTASEMPSSKISISWHALSSPAANVTRKAPPLKSEEVTIGYE
jgi:hypothetical protein